MRLSLVAGLVLAAIAGSACEHCSCGGYVNYATVVLTEKDAFQTVPVGAFQSVGVLLPGSHRTVTPSDAGLLVPYGPAAFVPDGMTLLTFRPDQPGDVGRPFVFGGVVSLSAPATADHPLWMAQLIIGTDPLDVNFVPPSFPQGSGAFTGGGTTVMALGQSFVVSWSAGGGAPTSGSASVLQPLGAPVRVHSAWQGSQSPPYSVRTGPEWLQQLFVAVGVGSAMLTVPDAVHTLDRNLGSFGGNQTFVVRSTPDFSCTVDGGCHELTMPQTGPTRPDHHYPAGQTPPA